MSEIIKAICCTKGNALLIIGNAAFWATAILAVSKLAFPVSGNSLTIPGILIACWFAVHLLIQRRK